MNGLGSYGWALTTRANPRSFSTRQYLDVMRMSLILTGFSRSPDGGRGLARDFRVRWACEEVGQAYEVRLLSFADLKTPEHRKLNPFGQIPTLQDGDLHIFESGAIVQHIA